MRLFYVPAQHEFGVFGNVLLHQVLQQTLHDLREVLQLIMQSHGQQTGHVSPVPLREALLGLQGVDELRHTESLSPAAQALTCSDTAHAQHTPW